MKTHFTPFFLLFLFLIWLISPKSYAQFQMKVDTTYFKNEKISKVSAGKEGNIWVIKGEAQREVAYINQKGRAVDLSASFQQYVKSAFTDILGMDHDTVLVGTARDYLIRYCNGNFIHLDEKHGLGNRAVNSILKVENSTSIFLSNGVVVGTDSSFFYF